MISLRKANVNDSALLFDWANDSLTRANSYRSAKITLQEHENWFAKKIKDPTCRIYIFTENTSLEAVGMVRIEQKETECVIGISIDKNWRGRSFSTPMLQMACRKFLEEKPATVIFAYIKTENSASFKSFSKAGFKLVSTLAVQGVESYKMLYSEK